MVGQYRIFKIRSPPGAIGCLTEATGFFVGSLSVLPPGLIGVLGSGDFFCREFKLIRQAIGVTSQTQLIRSYRIAGNLGRLFGRVAGRPSSLDHSATSGGVRNRRSNGGPALLTG